MKRAIAAATMSSLVALCVSASANDDASELLFARRIAPLLQEKCIACHGQDADDVEGGLDLRTGLNGLQGDSGEALISAGAPESSPVFLAARRDSPVWSPMPPKDSERLTEEQLQWLSEWISTGARWPDADRLAELQRSYTDEWSVEDGIMVATSGGLSRAWTERKYKPEGLWAYQPLSKQEPPEATGNASDAAIDRWIAARMPDKLELAPPADRRTLIRRATFDLTGLPPSPADVAAFENDPAEDSDAFAKVVDRLLDSPHYGERMAQHWLDVTRYADSSGFANDYERGNAWRYRDYVVRAFNNDKPYDEFVREQIAGDEMYETQSENAEAEGTSPSTELLVATGFLRMGPWELTGMEVAKIARQRFLDDVTNSVGETFLAHSLQCARCHDHKFDPVPTRDYYSIQAVFATTQLAEREADWLDCENLQGFEERGYLLARERELQEMLDGLAAKVTVESARQWLAENELDATEFERAVAEVAATWEKKNSEPGGESRNRAIPLKAVRKLMQDKEVHPDLIPPKSVGFTPDDYGNERVARKGLERLRWELERYEPFALSVYSGRTPKLKAVYEPLRISSKRMTEGEFERSCILTGGDPFSEGEAVAPSVLSVVGACQLEPIPDSAFGRRLAFASWVAHPDNPLTTRAIVNRIWMWHFNKPIAGNPNNFGSTGKLPTHLELLDWLAATFVEDGWSIKSLHRTIMLSQAYRRSTTHPDPQTLAQSDPSGSSYAVFEPRRLTAEELRDAMLFATGELNRAVGGIPNRPEINLEAALQPRQVMGTFASAWVPNPLPEQRHRRSLYSLKLRGLVDPLLEVFNSPAPDFSCERRDASTVTPQVFSLFNGRGSHSRALALAQRVTNETISDRQAVSRCYELVYARTPSATELETCIAYWQQIESMLPVEPLPAAPPLLSVRRDAVEENTGERFSFEERLYANEDFVADLQPCDVSRHVRGLADVCLAIFNSNEFVYVY